MTGYSGSRDREQCSMCGVAFREQPWIVLNRWVAGNGSGYVMVEGTSKTARCEWQVTDSCKTDIASGPVVCWPRCAIEWIEGKMAEANVLLRQQRG